MFVTVATATTLKESPAAKLVTAPADDRYLVEHPTGSMQVFLDIDDRGSIIGAGTITTARNCLMALCLPSELSLSLSLVTSHAGRLSE
ncbi:hypothetical protein REMIM1_PE00390 (plasmid) [Rhizobium etli bv. mimosae str. Mim1]|nr:hypothetical protein REMIM1_PE00390 [Rhizobium etli bv. mimosae str. Mim1]